MRQITESETVTMKRRGRPSMMISFDSPNDHDDSVKVLEAYRLLHKALKESKHIRLSQLAPFIRLFIDKLINKSAPIVRLQLFEEVGKLEDGSKSKTTLHGNFKSLEEFKILIESPTQKMLFEVNLDVESLNEISEWVKQDNLEAPISAPIPHVHTQSTLRPRTTTRGVQNDRTIQLSVNNQSMMAILMSILPDSDVSHLKGNLHVNVETDGPGVKEVSYEITTKTAEKGKQRSVMKQEDIPVYMACTSVTYFSLVKDKEDNDFGNGYNMENNLHAHIDDIAAVVYPEVKSISTPQRNRVREALERIRTTTVDFYGIEDIYSIKDITKFNMNLKDDNSNVPEKARLVEFRPFEKFSREELIYRKNGKISVIDSSVDYNISLNRDVFRTLKDRDFHFLIPPALLGKKTMLFNLYMQFRYKFNKTSDFFQISFDKLFFPHGVPAANKKERDELLAVEVKKFRKLIFSIQNGKPKPFLTAEVTSRFRHKLYLYGYSCEIDYKNEIFDVHMQREELLEAANTAPRRTTPTISNKLQDVTYLEAQEDSNVSSPLRRLSNMLNVEKYKYLVSFEIEGELLGVVSPLNREVDDLNLQKAISQRTEVPEDIVKDYLKEYFRQAMKELGDVDQYNVVGLYTTWCYENGKDAGDVQSQLAYYQHLEQKDV
ncbi:hypothetical protein [Vibrio cyclitrophicus]|uniref:hypothetical protein n=1 Tax=Vibrio cyclitrophicus TaxID=47951 RepID=UPI0032E459A4